MRGPRPLSSKRHLSAGLVRRLTNKTSVTTLDTLLALCVVVELHNAAPTHKFG
jgi:hypothetical protein